MWDRLNKLIDGFGQDPASMSEMRDEELKLASAALLVHATLIDGSVDETERDKLKTVLADRFDLAASDVAKLIDSAREREQSAVDLYGFTKTLARELDQEGRQKIVEMLWEMVLADGVVHEFESNLVWRVAELLGVSSRDRIRLRKQVESRQ